MPSLYGKERITQLKASMEAGLVKALFDLLRNYLICATIFGLGVFEYQQKPGFFLGVSVGDYSGVPIIILASALFILNTYDGIRMSIRHINNIMARAAFIVAYLSFAIRLIDLAWKYSAPGTL